MRAMRAVEWGGRCTAARSDGEGVPGGHGPSGRRVPSSWFGRAAWVGWTGWLLMGVLGCAADEEAQGDARPLPAASVASVPSGYTKGGLLGRYATDATEAPFLVRIEEALDFTAKDPAFGGLADGGAFVATYTGALRVTEPGVWRVGVTVAGGAVMSLGGDAIVDVPDSPDLTTALVRVAVEPGWVPVEVVYRRLPLATHLQVWAGPEGALIEPLSGDAAGWPTDPPAGEPALDGTVLLGVVTPYRADVHVECTSPARLSIAVEGPATGTVTADTLSHAHVVSVPLAPNASHTVRVTLTDLWGRTAELPALKATTPAIPAYQPGGLLGRYHQGKSFDTEVAVRVDAGVDLPADGETAGSYGLPMQSDNFSVRWEGGVKIDKAGSWTFHVGADDGQRLWVDGVQVLDLWSDHGFTVASGTLSLEEGWHAVRLEHYEAGGAAQVRLEWEGPGKPRQPILGSSLGWVMPSGLAGPPIVTELEVMSGPQPERVRATWRTKALASCSAKVGGQTGQTYLANAFAIDVSGAAELGQVEVLVTCHSPDGSGNHTATATVLIPKAPATVLEDFGAGTLAATWETLDEVPEHPASLELVDGTLKVAGNPGLEGDPGTLPNAGLIAWIQGDHGDGELHTAAWIGDTGTVGLIVALEDGESWIRADVSPQAGLARFVRSTASGITELGRTEGVKIPQASWVAISVLRVGDALTLLIDGADVLSVTEPGVPDGMAGLYVWRSDHARFNHLSFTPHQ